MRPPRIPGRRGPALGLLAALALIAASVLPESVSAEVEKKPDPPKTEKPSEKPGKEGEPQPAGDDEAKAPEKGGDPVEVETPEALPPESTAKTPIDADEEDARFLERLETAVSELEETARAMKVEGLEVRAFLAPDALAYKSARTYLDLRAKGRDDAAARQVVRKAIPRWKRYQKAALFVVRLENLGSRPTRTFLKPGEPRARRPLRPGQSRQVFTLADSLDKKGLRVLDNRNRRVKTRLAGKPANLRTTKLTVHKFWVRGSGGVRKPKRSKPLTALVLEEETGVVELVTPRVGLEKRRATGFRIELHGWKRYRGPFEQDVIDLNRGGRWDQLEHLEVDVELPASGLHTSAALRDLLTALQSDEDGEQDPVLPAPAGRG